MYDLSCKIFCVNVVRKYDYRKYINRNLKVNSESMYIQTVTTRIIL